MRLPLVRTICLKELLETLRDRRTLFVMFVLPMLMYPLLLLGLGALMESHLAEMTSRKVRLAVWGTPRPGLLEAVKEQKQEAVELVELESAAGSEAACAAAREALLQRKVDLILRVNPERRCPAGGPLDSEGPGADGDGGRQLAEGGGQAGDEQTGAGAGDDAEGTGHIGGSQVAGLAGGGHDDQEESWRLAPLGRLELLYDGAEDVSALAAERMRRVLREHGQQELRRRLGEAGLDPALVAPYAIRRSNLAGAERMGGHFAGRILPLVLVLMVILGSFYPAIDMTAGEKERGTLETLVSAPVHPTEIVAGKYLAVVIVAMMAALVNLASMGLTIHKMTSSIPQVGGTFSLSLSDGLVVLALLLPTALFFSALMLALATLARDFKEAQSLLSPVYMACLVPAMAASMPGVELSGPALFAPGFNITLVIRDVLAGKATADAVFGVILANGIYAVLALLLAARLLASEKVLFSNAPPWRGWRGLLRGDGAGADLRDGAAGARAAGWLARLRRPAAPGSVPSAGGAMLYFCVTLVLLYYVASTLQARDVVSGLLVTEWGLLLVPALAVALLGQHDLRAVFRLRLPGPGALAGSLLVAVSAWTLGVVAAAAMELVLPMPESFVEALRRFFDVSTGQLDVPAMLFLLALSPAICEEAAFRGIILAGLGPRLGRWGSVLVVGLLFGVFHLSIYRVVPTAVLGMVITYAVWQSGSILTGVLIHFATNAIVFGASSSNVLGAILGLREGQVESWWQVAGFGLLLVAGLALLARERPDSSRERPLDAGSRQRGGSAACTG